MRTATGRFAVVFALVSVSVSGFARVASAAVPGDQLWVKTYNGPGNLDDHATATGVSPDGSEVFVTGQSTGSTSGADYTTIAYNTSTGSRLWLKRYNGSANSADQATALGVSPDGSKVFVTGSSFGSTSSFYATLAYDAATGAKLWVKLYSGAGHSYDQATVLGVSPDGSKVFVTGYSFGSTSGYDYATVAYDASTGTKLWVMRYNGTGNNYDVAAALRVSPDGSEVFVTGHSLGSTSGDDYATIAYKASTGAKLWAKRYNGPGNGDDAAGALGVSPDGSKLFVSGGSTGSTSGYDDATIAYNASTGSQLWLKRYNGTGNNDDVATAVGMSPDGSTLFVTGVSVVSGGGDPYDYATVNYDASTGAKLWVKFYNGPGNAYDAASALEVSPDGSKVFVAGYSTGSTTGYDYATLAYDAATGGRLWATRYDGPGNADDFANDLVVSPDGSKVFVTGGSTGSTNNFDYATIAHAA
jgi:PQQ-like domain